MPETVKRQLLRNVQNFFRSYLNAFLPAYHPVLADDMVKRRINIMMAAAGILFMVFTSRISEHFEVSASAGYLALTDSLVSILVILSLIQFRGRWSLQIASAAILYYLISLAADYYLHRMNPPMVYAFFGAIVLALHFLTGRWISLISVAFLSLLIPVIEIVHNKRYLFTDDFKNSKGFFINIAVSGFIIWLIAESYRSALTAVIRKLNAVANENERDLELSRSIQTALLPEDIPGGPVEMAGYMKSAGKVGGDFYDASQAGGYYWFALGDVTGHGMHAGLVIMQIRSLLSHYLNTRPTDLPSDILRSLNNSFYNAMSPLREYYYSYYMSITLLRISPEGELLLAGHHPGNLLYRKKKFHVECITSEGPLLGVRFIPDEETVFHDKKILLDPGDIFLVYSDGITEAQNAEGESFGLSGIISSFSTALSLREDLGLKAINYSVIQDMLHFTGSATLSDDISLLTVRYSGNDA